jgi:hypothetical protein
MYWWPFVAATQRSNNPKPLPAAERIVKSAERALGEVDLRAFETLLGFKPSTNMSTEAVELLQPVLSVEPDAAFPDRLIVAEEDRTPPEPEASAGLMSVPCELTQLAGLDALALKPDQDR